MAKRKPAADNGQTNHDPSAEASATAVAEPPKKRGRPAKQPMLNDDPAFERIKEIEDVATAYVTARDMRQQALEEEVKMKVRLIDVMKKHDLSTYNFDGYMVERDHIDEDTIKVKKARAAQEDGSLA